MRVREEHHTAPATLIRDVATAVPVARALSWAGGQAAAFAAETINLAEIPAPTFGEAARAVHTARRFEEIGLKQVEIDSTGNVYGLLPGIGRAAAAFVAHLDTVFPANISHTVTWRDARLYGPGVGDNAAGLAGMIGAVQALRTAGVRPIRPVWFVASVGEEGLGNLCGATAATNRLGAEVDAMIAVEGSFFGRLSYTGVGSRRLEITCRAQGGHSWHDFGRPGAVHSLVRTAAAITNLPIPTEPRTSYNIGRIEGGSGVNVIAEEARMLLDMRSIDPHALDHLTAGVRSLIAAQGGPGVEFEVREVGFRPAGETSPDHELIQTCKAVLRWLGVTPQCAPASTDANIPLSRGIPAVTLGVTRGGGAHTRGEWIETQPLTRGVQQLILMTMALSDPRSALAPHR
jgi:tripeptide aminopeptidase